MLDIWEIYDYLVIVGTIFLNLLKEKPAESLTAIFLFIGLWWDRSYRKKAIKLEVISYKKHPQENIHKELVFRIINTGGVNIHLRSKGAKTFNKLVLSQNDAYAELDGYEYPVYDNEETLFPGKSIRVKILEWKGHNTGGIAYIYAIDQTGKRWCRYLDLKTEIKYKCRNFKVT